MSSDCDPHSRFPRFFATLVPGCDLVPQLRSGSKRLMCSLTRIALQAKNRQRAIARPRQMAMYLCKKLTTRSLPEIGKKFGGRDHTTILYGVRKIEELKAKDSQIADDLELLRRSLEA